MKYFLLYLAEYKRKCQSNAILQPGVIELPPNHISYPRSCSDIFRSNKPSSIRNEGVCLYYKECLPLKERTDLETLSETIVAEIKLNRKEIFLVLTYCHPNMPNIEIFEYT